MRHRQFSDDELLEGGENEDGDHQITFRLVSKPLPWGIKGCLKQRHLLAGGTGGVGGEGTGGETSDSDSIFTDDGEPYSTSNTPQHKKSVRLLEPSKVSLEALREYWSGTEDAGGGGGSGPGVGIGGYRRTRDFYVKGQGGSARVKREDLSINTTASQSTTTTSGISTPPQPSSPARSSPRLNSPSGTNSMRHHSPSTSPYNSHPSSPSRSSSLLRPNNRSGSPFENTRSSSPSSLNSNNSNMGFRTSSPLGGGRRRRTGSNASLTGNSYLNNSNNHNSNNASSNSNSTNIISISERSTPRWITTKTVHALEESPVLLSSHSRHYTKGGAEVEESDDDENYEDISGSSSLGEISFEGIGDETFESFPVPPSVDRLLMGS